MKQVVVIVDAGHGTGVVGKESPNGVLKEYAWNRDCANELVVYLKSNPAFVPYMTTAESEGDVPLQSRTAFINKIHKQHPNQPVVVVSIHCDAYGDGKSWTDPHGWAIWTSNGTTESDSIARAIWLQARRKFGSNNVRQETVDGDPDYEAGFWILRKSSCPAVLIENFFMTNKKDYEYLISPKSIYECSEVIYNGLKSYYGV